MNFIQFCKDYGVSYVTEGKNIGPGWIGMKCPFCDDPSEHLGFNLEREYFNCWRCGWHPVSWTISQLTGITESEARKVIRQYGGSNLTYVKTEEVKTKKKHLLPSDTTSLTPRHKQYLAKRGFDPERLEREWNLLGTGPMSMLDEINYKHRILIPIIWNNQQVSFTTRDITGRHPLRYMACLEERELIHYKDIIYGKQERWRSAGICVEGPFAVWRFGFNSFATFGINYTARQLRVIAKTFKRVGVAFDPEPQAKTQADKLVADLRFRNVDAFRIDLLKDPDELSQEEINYIVKQVIT